MKRNAVRFCVASLLLVGLAGCGGGGGSKSGGGGGAGSSTVAVSGVAQGPVVSGTVTIQNVTSPITTSALGVFSATVPASSNVDLTATGNYFDEVSGKVSTTSILTLNSFASSSDTALNVNILTTLAYQRIKTLITAGKPFAAARQQAEQEVLAAFYIRDQPPASTTYNGFGTFDLSTPPPGRDEDHILAAITSVLEYGGASFPGGINSLITSFQSEIATNNGAIIASPTISALSAIGINPTAIAANLTAEYKSVSASLYSAANISDWLDLDGDHVIEKFKFKAVQAAAGSPYTFPLYRVGASDNGATYKIGTASSTCAIAVNGVAATTVATGNPVAVTCTPGLHEASTTYLQSVPSLPTVPINLTTPINIARYDFSPFATVANMTTARTDATVTLLPSGKVLVAGGLVAGTTPAATTSVELYDPATGTWSLAKSMNVARVGHTATLLNNGFVLVVGGDPAGKAGTSELYNPSSNTWTKIGSTLATGHIYHTATQLLDGNVLVVGGITYTTAAAGAVGTPTGSVSVELYNPISNSWSVTGLTLAPTTTTPITFTPANPPAAATAVGTTPTATPSLTGWRYHHTATLLQNGMVLIWGGFDGKVSLADAELFDPGDISVDGSLTPAWIQVIPTTGTIAASNSHTATLSPDGMTVLIAGGFAGSAQNQVTVFNSANLTTTSITLSTSTLAAGNRYNHIAQPVADSSGGLNYVLIAGGDGSSGTLTSAELCDFSGNCNINGNMTYARDLFGSAMLNRGPNSGKVLLVGGQGVTAAETFQ